MVETVTPVALRVDAAPLIPSPPDPAPVAVTVVPLSEMAPP